MVAKLASFLERIILYQYNNLNKYMGIYNIIDFYDLLADS